MLTSWCLVVVMVVAVVAFMLMHRARGCEARRGGGGVDENRMHETGDGGRDKEVLIHLHHSSL